MTDLTSVAPIVSRRIGQLFCLLMFVCFLSLTSLAQTTSTTILGTVTDSTGAVVAGAKVTVSNNGTGVSRSVTTSSTGDYSFPLLDVGTYTVTVDAQGFKSGVHRGLILQINEKLRADFALEVGATTEKVEITSEGPTLRTDDATLGQTIEQRRVEELPLNNRNLGALAILQPGVQYGPRSGTDGQGFGQRQGSHGIPIPGVGLSFVANGQRETNQHDCWAGAEFVPGSILSLRQRRAGNSGRPGLQERGLFSDQEHATDRKGEAAVSCRDFQPVQHAAICRAQ